MQTTTQDLEYIINPKGIEHYKEISGKYENLALRLLMDHLFKRLSRQAENPVKYGEKLGWVSVPEAKEITVNASSLLEDLYEHYRVERKPREISSQPKVSNG